MTLRELLPMAEARGRSNWAHTSVVLAMIANVNRDPKKHRPFKPSDFDPYLSEKQRDKATVITDMGSLKGAFASGKLGR